MVTKQRLGEILIEKNLVSEQDIEQAVRIQVGGNRRLGHILVRMNAITADQLAETLADQLTLEICDIPQTFDSKVNKILPRYLCKQYGVLPLKLNKNNVLLLAMANPSDDEARNDLEDFTGKAIEPVLAKHSDIDKAIQKNIPLSIQDFFPSHYNTRLTQIGVAVSVCLVLLLGGLTYNFVHEMRYGTKSVTDSSVIYKNHDLLVGLENSGQIDLLGRGAYTTGYYSASFADREILQDFLLSKERDLSEKQKDWLSWVITQLPPGQPRTITSTD